MVPSACSGSGSADFVGQSAHSQGSTHHAARASSGRAQPSSRLHFQPLMLQGPSILAGAGGDGRAGEARCVGKLMPASVFLPPPHLRRPVVLPRRGFRVGINGRGPRGVFRAATPLHLSARGFYVPYVFSSGLPRSHDVCVWLVGSPIEPAGGVAKPLSALFSSATRRRFEMFAGAGGDKSVLDSA